MRPDRPTPYASQIHGVGAQPAGQPLPEAEQTAPENLAEPEKSLGRRIGHWTGLVMGCAVVGAVIGIAIVGILKFINGPVTATAKHDPLEAARLAAEPTPAMSKLSGKDLELDYPSIFDTVGQQIQATGVNDNFYISSKSNTSRAMALTVSQLKTNRLDDDSGYKWRSTIPETYKASPVKLGEGTAVLMTKADNTEASLFWAHNGKDLNLSITSTDPHDNVSQWMQQIMPTIRWK